MEKSLSDILEEKFAQCRELDLPLADRLLAFTEEVRKIAPPFAAAVDRLVERLADSSAGEQAPKPGELMPPFVLPDERGNLVSLDELLADGPTAIAFHRGYWCPYCRININALARAEVEIAPQRRHIVAIVPDRQKFSVWLKTDAGAPFPVLTDIDNAYAMSLGLAFWVGEEMRQLMASSGSNPRKSQGTEEWLLPIPATFIVGTDGIITSRYVDPDYRTRMEIDDIVSALKLAK